VFANMQSSGSLNWLLTGAATTGPLSVIEWKSWLEQQCVRGVLTGENSRSLALTWD